VKKKKKMNRRKFIKLTAAGAATTGVAALMIYSDRLFKKTPDLKHNSITVPQDVKKTFAKCGACSHTFFYLLNREFGHPRLNEERASDPLAGGLMNKQHQCGMLWGATLAVGAEAFRRYPDRNQAQVKAMTVTQHLVESFSNRAKTVNCRDIIGFDISNRLDVVKFMIQSLPGGFSNSVCMNLAEKWAPEAIQSAKEGLSDKLTNIPQPPLNCAVEVAKKMRASDEEMVTVAGFAGGIGLSGHACGALGAALWLNTLAWCRKHPGQSGYSNSNTKKILETFYGATDSEILCHKISGRRFKTIDQHAEFIKNGGCHKLINELASNYKII
jgi:hypothetical protein